MSGALDADETAQNIRYDRQIRLWGKRTQDQLRKSRVIVENIDAVTAEIAKDAILAGVGRVEVVNAAVSCSERHHQSIHFIHAADVDVVGRWDGTVCDDDNRKGVASALVHRLRGLNPFVEVAEVHSSLDSTYHIADPLATFRLVRAHSWRNFCDALLFAKRLPPNVTSVIIVHAAACTCGWFVIGDGDSEERADGTSGGQVVSDVLGSVATMPRPIQVCLAALHVNDVTKDASAGNNGAIHRAIAATSGEVMDDFAATLHTLWTIREAQQLVAVTDADLQSLLDSLLGGEGQLGASIVEGSIAGAFFAQQIIDRVAATGSLSPSSSSTAPVSAGTIPSPQPLTAAYRWMCITCPPGGDTACFVEPAAAAVRLV